MRRRTFLALPMAAAAASAGTDVVILVEDSPGFAPIASALVIPPIAPENRVAVLGFNSKTRLLGKFTSDQKQAEKAVRKASPRLQLGAGRGVQSKEIRVFDGLVAAAKLFDGDGSRRRAILLVFGSEDCCEAPGSLPQGIRIVALATPPYLIDGWAGSVATPTTVPGQRLPKQGRLPEATIGKLRDRKAMVMEGRPELARALEVALDPRP